MYVCVVLPNSEVPVAYATTHTLLMHAMLHVGILPESYLVLFYSYSYNTFRGIPLIAVGGRLACRTNHTNAYRVHLGYARIGTIRRAPVRTLLLCA